MNFKASIKQYADKITVNHFVLSAGLTFVAGFLAYLVTAIDPTQITYEGLMHMWNEGTLIDLVISLIFGAFLAGIRALVQIVVALMVGKSPIAKD